MDHGIELEVVWFDQDIVEVAFRCSNSHFAGSALIYLSYDDLPNLLETLKGFPSGHADTRQSQLGTFNSNHADGGVRLNFYCRDSRGHAFVEVKLRGDGCEALGEAESVALRIPIEAAGVDGFLAELDAMQVSCGARAALPMAK